MIKWGITINYNHGPAIRDGRTGHNKAVRQYVRREIEARSAYAALLKVYNLERGKTVIRRSYLIIVEEERS